MPAGSTVTVAASSAGSSELIRLWRSRLDTLDARTSAVRRQRPAPLEGILSQQLKMSQIQDISPISESRDSSDTEVTRQKSEIDETEDSEERDAPNTPKSERGESESSRSRGGAQPGSPASDHRQQLPRQQSLQSQQQQIRSGECNSLPVLVERLRSALELSCSEDHQNKPHQQQQQQQQQQTVVAPEDSGVDSEEDLRLWSAAAAASRLDFNLLEDALLADIHTALAALQETLKRVDIGALARYSASLDPPNKIHLLRLISSLLTKLKPTAQPKPLQQSRPSELPRFHNRRRRNDRHTIGVSANEVARARRWLLEQSSSVDSPPPQAPPPPPRPPNKSTNRRASEELNLLEDERVVEGASDSATPATPLGFDKCMKDAINHNQQQSRRDSHHSRGFEPLILVQNGKPSARRYSSDHTGYIDSDDISTVNGIQQRQSRPNKFSAKRSKIKRANTIDIPNYLALNRDYGSPERAQNGCYALRRPIDVSDRLQSSGGPDQVSNPVPSFEPKTDSDRKFLALISKNSEKDGSVSPGAPFKSFNYRQASDVADKNWNNRFSTIKTNFDKPNNEVDTKTPKRKSGILDVRKKFENRDNSLEREGLFGSNMGSVRAPKQRENGFTHASTSPFQKIEKTMPKPENVPTYLKAGYLPKNSGMLQAKLKMFDNDASKKVTQNYQNPTTVNRIENSSEPYIPTPYREIRSKEVRIPKQSQENEDQNYYSFCKQLAPFSSGKTGTSDSRSNINATKSKLLVNINKDYDRRETKKEKPKQLNQMSRNSIPQTRKNSHETIGQFDHYKMYDNHPPRVPLRDPPDIAYVRPMHTDLPVINNRNSYQVASEESEFVKPEKPPRRFEAPTQNVAVQTTHELNRRNSVPEILHPVADFPRDNPLPRIPQHNAFVQTSNSRMVPTVQHADQEYIQNPPDFQLFSSEPHAHNHYEPLPPEPLSSCDVIYPKFDVPTISKDLSTHAHSLTENQIPRETIHDALPSKPYDQHSYEPYSQHLEPTPNSSDFLNDTSISQRLYDEFNRLPEVKSLSEFSKVHQPFESSVSNIPVADKQLATEILDSPVSTFLENKPLPDLIGDNIQNQDISSDGIVTRYTCAIATVSSKPESPEPLQEVHSYEPVVPRIKEPQPRHFAETTSLTSKIVPSEPSADEIKRHNMLQQSLIRRMQQQNESGNLHNMQPTTQVLGPEITLRARSRSPTSPRFGQACMLKALNEGHKAQEKISMFEDKKQMSTGVKSSGNIFRPVNSIPRLNVEPVQTEVRSPRRGSPIDSSDEYLMSCASRPSRNIVLSKSESWHQLAMARTLQPAPSNAKPPKPKSPARLSKQFEASLPQDNARKMEEKIQRYFQGSTSQHPKAKRNLRSKADRVQLNSLSRSRTMPHLYDDRIFDDNVDVDTAFDSIFKEATRSDTRL